MPEIKKLQISGVTVNRVYKSGSEVYRVIQNGVNTVFHRQLSFGNNTSIDQVSRTTSSITWRLYNSDPNLSVNTHTSINSTSYNSFYGTIAANGNSLITVSGLASGTTYTIYQRNSRSDFDIQPVFNQNTWSTVEDQNQTATPTINVMSCIFDENGNAVTFSVTNNDGSTATIFVAENSGFSGQQSATVGAGGSATFTFYGYLNPPGTVTFYARAQASGKTMSNTTSRTQNITRCLGGF
jgi:hypothetical protein